MPSRLLTNHIIPHNVALAQPDGTLSFANVANDKCPCNVANGKASADSVGRVEEFPPETQVLAVGDVLSFESSGKGISELRRVRGLVCTGNAIAWSLDRLGRSRAKRVLFEVTLSASSPLLGQSDPMRIAEVAMERYRCAVLCSCSLNGNSSKPVHLLEKGDKLLLEADKVRHTRLLSVSTSSILYPDYVVNILLSHHPPVTFFSQIIY